MQEYIGKICPYCKTEIKEGDNVVLCSDCDMPHHKECWVENQGCTTFGCMGTIKSVDGTETSVTTDEIQYEETQQAPVQEQQTSAGNVFCTRCGAPNSKTATFCVKCGTQLSQPSASTYTESTYSQTNYSNGYTQSNTSNGYAQSNQYSYTDPYAYQQPAGEELDPDVIQLIGTKREYYIPKFLELKRQKKQTSWNWPAFFVAPYWFIYRKMYLYGGLLLLANLILSVIDSGVISLGGYIVLSLFANNIYMKYLEKMAQQAKNLSEPYRTEFLQKNSGVNSTAVILTIIGFVVLGFLLV